MSLDHFSELISWRQGLSTARGGLRCALGRGFPARKKLHTHTGRVVYSGVPSHWPQYGDGVAAQRAEQQREILGRSRRRRRRGGGTLGTGKGPAAADGSGNSRAQHTRPRLHKGCRTADFFGDFQHSGNLLITNFGTHNNNHGKDNIQFSF